MFDGIEERFRGRQCWNLRRELEKKEMKHRNQMREGGKELKNSKMAWLVTQFAIHGSLSQVIRA